MPDFSALLKKPVGSARRPPNLPGGSSYEGIIKSHEFGEIKNDNRTPYVRFHLSVMSWDPNVVEEWSETDPSSGESFPVKKSDIDLSKRSLRKDFFLTPDAEWRLHKFLLSLGGAGMSAEEFIPQTTGRAVVIDISQRLVERDNSIMNDVRDVIGKAA